MNVLPMVNKGLALFQWKQDMEAAEKCCQEALEIDPECEAAVATLAQLSLQDVSDEARAEAARLKAEANKAFVCASSQLVLRHIRSCN